jgi:ATP-binding cassette subfamily F protein uup
MQYLTVKNIHKTFTMKPLLDGVEFSISKGQKVALVAQNGAGKSTLLKIIMGQIDPSQGEVVFNKNIRV